jgi:hypothetical protein
MQAPCPPALFRYRAAPAPSASFVVRDPSSRRRLLRMEMHTSAGNAQNSASAGYDIAVTKPVFSCLATMAISYRAHLHSAMGCLHHRTELRQLTQGNPQVAQGMLYLVMVPLPPPISLSSRCFPACTSHQNSKAHTRTLFAAVRFT